MTRLQGSFCLFGTSLIWGMAFIAQSTGMESIGPFTFIAVRFLLGALALLPFAIYQWRQLDQKNKPQVIRWSLIAGSFLFAGACAQQIGLLSTSVTNSGFLTSLYVPLVPIFMLFLFRTPPHIIVWPAVTLSFLGTFLISGGDIMQINRGDMWQILGAFFFTGHIISLSYAMKALPKAVLISCGQFIFVFIAAVPLAFTLESPTIDGVLNSWPELAFTGFISSGIAFLLQMVGQKVVPPSQATLIMAMEAVFAAVFAWLILSEELMPIAYLGCGLIFVATLLVEIVPEIWKKDRAHQ